MTNEYFIRAHFDIDCKWKHDNNPPNYRVFINDQLITERTWIWTDSYLSEMLQLNLPKGQYQMQVVPVGNSKGKFYVSNNRMELGPARWLADNIIEVYGEI